MQKQVFNIPMSTCNLLHFLEYIALLMGTINFSVCQDAGTTQEQKYKQEWFQLILELQIRINASSMHT